MMSGFIITLITALILTWLMYLRHKEEITSDTQVICILLALINQSIWLSNL